MQIRREMGIQPETARLPVILAVCRVASQSHGSRPSAAPAILLPPRWTAELVQSEQAQACRLRTPMLIVD
jgi:hypothetical protein